MSDFVALLQMNPRVGDLENNAKKLEKMIILSKENGAKLAVSSELAISGYPPRDLLNNDEFLSKIKETTEQVNSPIPH